MVVKLALLFSLIVMFTKPAANEGGRHSWRYVFPFFPEELDVLLGHLRTNVVRLEDVLKQCTDMAEGEWKGGSPNRVMRLSAPEADSTDEEDMEEKVERILELRETISELEDEIEECRFYFWTGG